eukprot:jgi/Ulvmu1/6327/UM029_0035.1
MSSGFGLHGFEGRCYQFWREVQACLHETDGNYKQCGDNFEDYMECLHHKKEIRRKNAILLHAYEKQQATHGHGEA